MPLLNMRMARPELLIDVAKIKELDFIRETESDFSFGAMTRQRNVEFSEGVRVNHPLLYQTIRNIAHPQNRNQGTIGGSLAHADPAAELPALAVALNAEFSAVGPDGERKISADEFFVTYLTTTLDMAEVLTAVRFPKLAAKTGWSFVEVARRHGDFALAGVIALVDLDGDVCQNSRIVLFGVDAHCSEGPRDAEKALNGEKLSESLLKHVGEQASSAIEDGISDVHATADQRHHLGGVLTGRAVAEAVGRAKASS